MPRELGKVFVCWMKLTPPREKEEKNKDADAVLLCISMGYKLPQVTPVALSWAYTNC